MKRINFLRLLAVCLASMAALTVAQTVNVVEYRNKTLNAYFITGRAAEQAALDAVPDFARTGMSFQAGAAATAAASLTRICRFYVSIANPFVNSHFYGRQGTDCEAIQALSPAGFSYEGYDFAVQAPVNLVCPPGTVPVYRSFRALANGVTSNHRYTVSSAMYANAATAGYAVEGVQFCATQATDVTPPAVGIAPSWTGVATSVFAPQNVSAQLTWTLVGVLNNVATYQSTGTATISGGVQPVCNIVPSTNAVDASGILFVDYNANPPTYHGGGSTSWSASLSCPPVPGTFPTTVTALYMGGNGGPTGLEGAGSVTDNGTVIQGTDTVGGSNVLSWRFTRN